MIEQETKTNPTKSLGTFNDIYHVWLSVGSTRSLDINVSDNVTNASFLAAEFDGHRYHIKNDRIFNDVYLKAMKQKPTLLKYMLNFFHEQMNEPDNMEVMKIRFTCFKRRVNIYIQKRIRETKQLLWD